MPILDPVVWILLMVIFALTLGASTAIAARVIAPRPPPVVPVAPPSDLSDEAAQIRQELRRDIDQARAEQARMRGQLDQALDRITKLEREKRSWKDWFLETQRAWDRFVMQYEQWTRGIEGCPPPPPAPLPPAFLDEVDRPATPIDWLALAPVLLLGMGPSLDTVGKRTGYLLSGVPSKIYTKLTRPDNAGEDIAGILTAAAGWDFEAQKQLADNISALVDGSQQAPAVAIWRRAARLPPRD